MVLYTQLAKQRGIQLSEVRNLSIYDFYVILEDITIENRINERGSTAVQEYGQ